jgi:hypothetical protein
MFKYIILLKYILKTRNNIVYFMLIFSLLEIWRKETIFAFNEFMIL